MYSNQSTQLDPVLQALITLQQKANPTTPTGQPTVAGQMMATAMRPQGLAQGQPPQQSPQQGLPSIVANAQQSVPSVQQNAQQGQVADMANKVAQQMQQQQRPPGITGLPVSNTGFKEGGIIPYADGGGVDFSGVQYGAGMAGAAPGIEGVLAPTPAMTESPEIATIRAKEAQMQALNRARPDYYAQSIAALEADKQARAEAAAEQKKRQGFEGLMALLAGGAKGGMGGMGEASTQFNKAAVARQDAARQANLLDAQMRVKLGELEHARQIGDITSSIGIEKEIAGIKHQMSQVAEAGRGHTLTAETARTGYKMTADTAAARLKQEAEQAALDRASRERIASLGQGAIEKKQDLALFLQEEKERGVSKEFEKANAMERVNPIQAAKIREGAVAMRNEILKKFPNLTKYDVPSIGAGPTEAPTSAPKADTTNWGTMKVNGK